MGLGKRLLSSTGKKILRAALAAIGGCCCNCCVLFEVYYNCNSKQFSAVQVVADSLSGGLTYLSCSSGSLPATANAWVKDETYVADEETGFACRWLYKKTIDCGVEVSPGDYPDPPANADDCTCPTPANHCLNCNPCCFSTLSRLAITSLSVSYSGAGPYSTAFTAALNGMDLSAMVPGFYWDGAAIQTKTGSEYQFASGTTGLAWFAWSDPFTVGGDLYRITLAAWLDCSTMSWFWLAEVYIFNTTTRTWDYSAIIARSNSFGDVGDCCGVEFTGDSVGAPGGEGGSITSTGATGDVSNNSCCGYNFEVVPGTWVRLCSDANTGDCVTGDCP